ncbi:ABC transporter ATP-binding protein [Clostridium amazonitimonense]|uniref:ABC transporter ATP-binding protein n=1 Tax=Clostridium amazonitimonense TaxID=1499689 RepID=UPI0005097339|nr:ABC transporter ATP-binding protein [Clostridium amazonitimonense]
MLDESTYDIVLQNTTVEFDISSGAVKAVDNVTATFYGGQITGLIGESGCGKSVLAHAILGMLPSYAKLEGNILYGDKNIASASTKEMRSLRGKEIGLIPQNPGDSLNPVRRIEAQLDEALLVADENPKRRKNKAESLLRSFGFDNVKRIFSSYPFELSGGMQQRVICTIGVACSPRWVLADEPTKGLDIDLRKQVYDTLEMIKNKSVQGMIVITHDLVLAEKLCQCIAVMYSGEIVEMGKDVLKTPLHPYTKGFLASLPENGMHPMKGISPKPGDKSFGCKFAPRCSYCTERCINEKPEQYEYEGRIVRCFLYA